MTEREVEEPVPKLPRGRGIKLSGPEIFRILLTCGMLVAILVLAKPCGDAVSSFVMRFDNNNAGSAMPRPGKVEPPPAPAPGSNYVRLTPGMTDEQVKAAIDEARHKQAGSAAPGVR